MTARDTGPGLAANSFAPADVLLRIVVSNHDQDIVTRFVWCRSLPAEVGEALVTHPDRRVRSTLDESWHAAPSCGPNSWTVGTRTLSSSPAVHSPTVRQSLPLPDWAYQRLLSHERSMVRHETVVSAYVLVHVLALLATHQDPVFRLAVCRRAPRRRARCAPRRPGPRDPPDRRDAAHGLLTAPTDRFRMS
jgi:hypothetical protein